ncbi:alkaline phosphatase family protein [Lutibacter sp. A80]|uniref:alkaline phosphatase D family protein n=1 Tax=Lutibacter sp. A80 TaxID=2918453 RepID=UPI001F057D9A|nr:alkaline phosphatase D family protein [Lutibacter sp. A80]UMB62044.1 alkaline phosphatase family protein [Lutibacter sp. A80]
MKNMNVFNRYCLVFTILFISCKGYSQKNTVVPVQHKVTLKEAHKGDLEIDTLLLDSYGLLPENIRQFYMESRAVFSENTEANFTDAKILESAKKHNLALIGGPMLGNLQKEQVTVWLRKHSETPITIKVLNIKDKSEHKYFKNNIIPGVEQRIVLDGLTANSEYKYQIYENEIKLAEGEFKTAPTTKEKGLFKVAFGSDFHKVGLHNPNLVTQILKRNPQVMLLIGDIAVDDRENKINLHRSDYLLRDMSKPWRDLSANVPLYTAWDDHDYFNNDLSGIPDRFTSDDVEAVREVWYQNWNNPEYKGEGIYFSTQIGPVEVIMLDTRSCRTVKERGQYGCYLGIEQQNWLKETLKNSKAPFKIISSGTMWSDAISNGKDSWGTWDTAAREEIFNFIETENIPGVLFISGDRHGTRAFNIPRPSGYVIHEFEAGTLGGVPGPEAIAKDATNQIFGYGGTEIIAFGEFLFNTKAKEPQVTFRLIDEHGKIVEKHTLLYNQLTPRK